MCHWAVHDFARRLYYITIICFDIINFPGFQNMKGQEINAITLTDYTFI